MAAFAHLPNELVEFVLEYLSQPDLYAFSQLNTSLSALATPFLYRHINLAIPPGDRLPRIDRFCFNIVSNGKLAARVETIRLGLSPLNGVKEGQRWLPTDKHFDDKLMFDKAMDLLSKETLVAAGDYLRDAISMREYSAYASLILLVLPNLQHLQISDFKCASLNHLHTALRNLDASPRWNSRRPSEALLHRLNSIKQISLNVDTLSGLAYPRNLGFSSLDHLLSLPGIKTVEMSIPDANEAGTGNTTAVHLGFLRRQLINKVQPTNITAITIRHSCPVLHLIGPVLSCTPQLRSFTFDMFYDCKDRETVEPSLLDLLAWSDVLRQVSDTLEQLVLGMEYCDTGKYFFQQPRIGDKLQGFLDLTSFENLRVLEVPFPFLTGDDEFRITTEIYPLLPPNLRHLSLRPDLSHAQHPFPFDTSILSSAFTFKESADEARHLMHARMDVSYMYLATLALLDHTSNLETISVGQPADPLLGWFPGQVDDFETTCRNKSISAKIVYPMLLRWKKLEHWNLIREVTVFDRTVPYQGRLETLHRGQRHGIPLGLASQYHLDALRLHHVRMHR